MALTSPKRTPLRNQSDYVWYDYYPSFSPVFVKDVIDRLTLSKNASIMDPWNGSGTTTQVSFEEGYRVYGYDLNPAMIVIAKARHADGQLVTNLSKYLSKITSCIQQLYNDNCETNDPLELWLKPSSARYFRSIEHSIRINFVSSDLSVNLLSNDGLALFSAEAAFFYISLFKTLRSYLSCFMTSNPTWIKEPATKFNRIAPSAENILNHFNKEVFELSDTLAQTNQSSDLGHNRSDIHINLADSQNLPIRKSKVEAVITSPPYCTRIDYAVLTKPELAILGLGHGEDFKNFRDLMIGTPTINGLSHTISEKFDGTCAQFLSKVRNHYSKASHSYYYNFYKQYFISIKNSIKEIYRVLKSKGYCVIVIQDSYYKDLHLDLPKIITEFCTGNGMETVALSEFPNQRSFVSVNKHAKRYRKFKQPNEQVVFLIKS